MKPFDMRSVVAMAAMALLAACGGSAPADQADGATATAALMVQGGNAPVADCEAEGCNRPRIIDGLAEQYRAGAIAQQAQPADPIPAAPTAGTEPQPATMPGAAPSAAPPAAAALPR